jgi:hypothetical protein
MPKLRRERNEPELYFAARIILAEHDDLIDSAPRGLLFRLERIAIELRQIEDRL